MLLPQRTALVLAACLAALTSLVATMVQAQTPERRFALVIGNSEYKAGKLPTGANDAGLIAETLRGAGFDVSGARDLDQDTLRRSMREFLDKVAAAGPQAVTFVYLSGYGVQFEGENYIVPIDANLRRDEDIPIEAIRVSDFTRPLAGTPGAVKIFIVDAGRQHPFQPAGPPLASGLSLVEPDAGMLIGFNATPGSIAPIEPGPYGAYAQSLAEMIGTGGLNLDDLFSRLRLRVNEKTNGLAVPWYASKVAQPFLFMERTPDAPPPPQVASAMQLQSQPIGEFRGDQEAYVAALERDTLGGYQEFIAAFPDSPLSPRVRALIAVRREAITWRRTVAINTPEAYWSYLRRYPQGAHVADCERRLARLAAAYDPPAAFMPMAYDDVPPPPPDEVVYLTQPVVVFDGPGFLPPPPIPVFFLPPPPPAFLVLAPPPPPIGAFFLPAPIVPVVGVGLFARPPAFVVRPAAPVVQQITINNTTIINRPGAGAGPVAAALPASVVTRVNAGALKPPPPAPPPPQPIHQTASLQGTGVLGNKQVALPPPQPRTGPTATAPTGPAATTAPGPAQGLLTPGGARPTGPTATPAPGGAPPVGLLAPGIRPTGPTTATPGAPPPIGPTPPGSVRPTGPATATTTPGTPPPAGPAPPGSVRPTGPTTATPGTPPGTPLRGPTTATPGGPPPPVSGTPPGGLHPTAPTTATTTPTGPAPGASTGARRPTGPTTATTTPGGPPPGGPPPAPRITSPPAQVTAPPPPKAPQVVNRPPPPPPPVQHAPPPPPPVTRAPPPPPPVVRAPPPPPPQAAARPGAPPAKKCVVQNGRQVCS